MPSLILQSHFLEFMRVLGCQVRIPFAAGIERPVEFERIEISDS
jgi:hypothetical protein